MKHLALLAALPLAFGLGRVLAPPASSSLSDPQGARRDPSQAEFRQFDFWVGEWDCQTPDGQAAGRNTIESILNGFVLRESWVGSGGSVGHSFNIYDAATGRWHQTWVDNSGTLLLLDGELQEDGSMLLEGARPAPDGTEVRHRVRWTPIKAEGGAEHVRQTWDSTSDGETWNVLADLIYVPRAGEDR